jgi:hypothetical protein
MILQTALQMKGWKSDVYEHFRMPPDIIVKKNNVVSYVFACRQYVCTILNATIY